MIQRAWLCAVLAFGMLAGGARAQRPEIAADRIATSAHAMAFDAKLQRIKFDPKTIAVMQASILDRIKASEPRYDARTADFSKRIQAAIAEARRPDERAFLTAALINRQLKATDKKLRIRYDFRNRVIYEQARSYWARADRADIPSALQRWLREGGLILTAVNTAYMSECAGQQVPVPPDFSLASTAWTSQGNIASNLLSPGNVATVWTWTDPIKRGACVALPRDNGGPGSFAGIICQSATTGRACFWDNLTRADPGRRIPTATETMVIRDLQDGRTLNESAPCTECHVGGNVFLMLPDDPAWRKIIKGPMNGPRPGTFTTIVEPQADAPGSARYTPIAHASWVNPPLTAGCSGPCHGQVSPSVSSLFYGLAGHPPMPPACRNPGNNYRNCYGTP